MDTRSLHPDVARLTPKQREFYYGWADFFQRFAVFEADEAHEVALARAMAEGCGSPVREEAPPMIIYGAR
jgi:hypothetical protein